MRSISTRALLFACSLIGGFGAAVAQSGPASEARTAGRHVSPLSAAPSPAPDGAPAIEPALAPRNPGTDEVGRGRPVRDVALLSLSGKELRLFDGIDASLLVIAFTGVGCPIAGKYAPRLERLAKRYGERGVRFVGVNANPQDSREGVARDLAELGITFPVLKDFRQELTRELGAVTMTEVFVLDAGRRLRYRGAVDDQYSLGAARPEPREKWLTDALDALLEGRAPGVSETSAPGCALTLLGEQDLPEAVTWSRDIAPIVQQRCEGCHRPEQVGPFSLQSYDAVKGWSSMILDVVEEGRMPPWNADPEFDGVFSNERRLPEQEKALLLAWIEDGMPRGNPDEDPAPVEWNDEWYIGEPHAVFTMTDRQERDGRELTWAPLGEGFRVPREGVVDYQYFSVETGFAEDRWVRAVECRPGAADVVHHILVMVDDPRDPGAWRRRGSFLDYFAVAVPGDSSVVYPEGYAKRLPAGARLVFQMHYTPNGKERVDRSSIAMLFADAAVDHEVHTTGVVNERFVIPAGERYHEVRASTRLEQDIRILALFPHMHTRGADFYYFATVPGGSEQLLLASNYDFRWQEAYVFREPPAFPAGTLLQCVGHFDNSEENPNNPDPTVDVRWGDQSFEEMFIGFYDYVID